MKPLDLQKIQANLAVAKEKLNNADKCFSKAISQLMYNKLLNICLN
jgi:hypothetical protein